jgi:hypothetical protein
MANRRTQLHRLLNTPAPLRDATFAQHMAMAQAWCRYNGQKGTDLQAIKVMYQLTASDLVRMLGERNVQLPMGCAQ